MVKALEGVHLLPVTPLNKDYTLNEDAIRKQVEWAVEKGVDGLWVTGYLGEANVLDEDVRKRALEVFIDAAGDRLYCAAGCAGINPFQCIRLVNYSEELGYDLAWIPPLVPTKPSDNELFEFYKIIHDNTTLPLAMYSTYAYGVYMRPSIIARIADLERMIAMKEVISDFEHIAGLYNLGVEAEVTQLMLGAAGCICDSHFLSPAMEMWKAFKSGDVNKALRIDAGMHGFMLSFPFTSKQAFGSQIDFSTAGFQKAACGMSMGIDMGPPMAPYAPPTEDQIKAIRKSVEEEEVPPFVP
jgi:4-hydroxy-tetrahydrodipicolinate synthase